MNTKELEKVVKGAVEEVVSKSVKDATSVFAKIKEINALKEEIETLKLEKRVKEWDFEKREMEIEHKIGLERKRQEFEKDEAKRLAVVEVREENLKAQEARFDEQVDFVTKRFTEEVGYLKDIVGQVLACVQGIKEQGNDSDVGK